ncbi:MAG: class I SAM-dependent methyltransferase [Terracidiphilus sp.]
MLGTDRLSGLEKLLARKSVGRILRRFLRPPEIAANPVAVRQAYRLWSSTYAKETLPHYLDGELAHAMLQGLPRIHLLDAGCGAGSRIRDIPGAVGIDLSPEMLAAGGLHNVIAGDIREMPFTSEQFDMVWCRLVIGHLLDPLPAYREFCRVCIPGGYVFVSDFHPDATLAGHRRTFNDQAGIVYKVEHYERTNHAEQASQAGLDLVATRDGAVGPSARAFYIHGIGRRAYLRDFGLNLVRGYLFRRPKNVRL